MAAQDGGLKGFYIGLGVVGIVGVGVLGYLVSSRKTVSIPANVAVLASDTAGFRGYVLGSDSAPVEIIEYLDYQCPGCQAFAAIQFPDVKRRLIQTGRVRWIVRDYPLDQAHRHARLAAHSTACADEQGKYWVQHERIFAGHADWYPKESASGLFRDYAREVGLDLDRYDDCMTSARYAGRIEGSRLLGASLGVNGTPTFLIGGRLYSNMSSDQVKAIVDSLSPARP